MRKLSLLLAAAIILFGVPALSITPSSAAVPTGSGCNIQPSNNDVFSAGCSTSIAASSYTVDYFIAGEPSTARYAWTPPSGKTIVEGCTSTSPSCVISTPGLRSDQELTGSAVVTVNGVQTRFSATAILNAVCGSEFC